MSRVEDKFAMYVSLDEQAAGWVDDLEDWESRRLGSLERARFEIARKTGLTQGQLERIRRQRLKGVRGYVAEKVRMVFVAALAREQARLASALDLAERSRVDLAPDAACEARAALGRAQELIVEAGRMA